MSHTTSSADEGRRDDFRATVTPIRPNHHLIPTVTDYSGEQLADEVLDLLERRLPLLAADDPYRPMLARTIPVLAASSNRSA